MVFCNREQAKKELDKLSVTILILIDGFLQFEQVVTKKEDKSSHNPYFNRWFSAIIICVSPNGTYKKSQSLF